MSVVYFNGQFIEEERAMVPIGDRGFLFGDGLFTTVKVEGGRASLLNEHLRRLISQCTTLGIAEPAISSTLVEQLIEKNGAYEGVWRMKILVTGGLSPALSLPRGRSGSLLITLKRVEIVSSPVRVTIYPVPIATPLARLKSLSYLERLFIAQYAMERGAEDALVCSPEGFLLEASFSNIYWVVGKELFTPSEELPLLFGVALKEIIETFEESGGRVYKGRFRLEEIPADSDIFLCNSLRGALPVERID